VRHCVHVVAALAFATLPPLPLAPEKPALQVHVIEGAVPVQVQSVDCVHPKAIGQTTNAIRSNFKFK
jgi:hypothetical protein